MGWEFACDCLLRLAWTLPHALRGRCADAGLRRRYGGAGASGGGRNALLGFYSQERPVGFGDVRRERAAVHAHFQPSENSWAAKQKQLKE